MEFQTNAQPIFLQIYDLLCDRVLRGEIKPDEQIPSVRELAVLLEVNPNTVMRTIERLLQQEIIYSKRGKGNFLAPEAESIIREVRTKRFLEEKLPALASEMKLLHFDPKQLQKELEKLMN
ncbi:MAG: GntR family transcriptional regulator [Bacteroidales bacterium]|jgi:DNA-binding transcriptional regulator YhcF (GntR family)|nr:GntR family transcriptional regulator [Bacteroidales bacterium]MBO7379064.1 GntR family transcriptional regulator [Bacteroidales bacterium]MBP5213161.1 GntR family transcriptional regulator [Bacteroidales bacterium]MBP5763583.1 GntR family transcriptional regulator [Bacteroidales bacterium]